MFYFYPFIFTVLQEIVKKEENTFKESFSINDKTCWIRFYGKIFILWNVQ